MKKLAIILLVLLATNSLAATISGEVFEWYTLEPLNNVIIEVDSTPLQRTVSKDGAYQFELNPGNYIITASYVVENQTIYEIKENITIKEEGTYYYDLILTPSLDEDVDELLEFEEDLEDIEPILQETEIKQEFTIIPLLIILIVIIVLSYFHFKPKKQEEENLDKYANEVLQILKKSGNRLTQKEIRDKINIGEAKVSLIITELEQMGKIKKIKKGRGNIIILK